MDEAQVELACADGVFEPNKIRLLSLLKERDFPLIPTVASRGGGVKGAVPQVELQLPGTSAMMEGGDGAPNAGPVYHWSDLNVQGYSIGIILQLE